MSRELFGTDGLRGLAGKYPLDQAGAEKIGRAIGAYFAKPGQMIVLAQDPRESSAGLAEALTAGLTSVGINVTLIGVLPTPGLAYVTRRSERFAAGVMVTASHNPYDYNGIKVFDAQGDKLSDKTDAALNDLIERGVDIETPPGQPGTDHDLIKQYEDFLVGTADGLKLTDLKLAIDSANGAASGLAERVFARLGADVTSLADRPDGRNINAKCGATDTETLRRAVVEDGLDLGIALDGDADRLVMIDAQGREVNGDYLLYLLAVTRDLKGVVATVMSNLGLEQALDKHGIKLDRVQVGDRYVLEGLQQTGYRLGGEQSGHIIFPELLKTGDGLLAAVQVVRALGESGKTLAQWRGEVSSLPQALINIKVTDKNRLELPEVQAFIRQQTGALQGKGRLLVRSSGTEPVVRVMVEAPAAETVAKRIADKLQGLLR